MILVYFIFTISSFLPPAKEEALKELRNANPNRSISVILPDHCSEHIDKITQVSLLR